MQIPINMHIRQKINIKTMKKQQLKMLQNIHITTHNNNTVILRVLFHDHSDKLKFHVCSQPVNQSVNQQFNFKCIQGQAHL